jgi:hypothetical protein
MPEQKVIGQLNVCATCGQVIKINKAKVVLGLIEQFYNAGMSLRETAIILKGRGYTISHSSVAEIVREIKTRVEVIEKAGE